MNKLVLIGNGFDLAHGLKTSYSDFLLWYINNAHSKFYQDMKYEDDLITIKKYNRNNRDREDSFNSISDFIKSQNFIDREYNVNYKNNFFEELIKHTNELNWVDIEYSYYKSVLGFFKWKVEEDFSSKQQIHSDNIKELNTCFEAIKHKLIEYLNTINTKAIYDSNIEENIKKFVRDFTPFELNNTYFLNFNYTTTIKNYLNLFITRKGDENRTGVKLVNIHGELNNEHNPIIFGYGDEMDPNYNAIENLNDNEYLKNIKSFNYFKTDNYQSFNSFIDSDVFDVFIFGHSCGISDRILLNSIFEHDKCNKIRIFYYKKDNTYNDYFEKTQEISRHFKAENKNRMRNLIVPFDQSCPIC